VKGRGDPREPHARRGREHEDAQRHREAGAADDSGVRAAREDADGQDDTNAQLRAMRAVWLSMREEDPPDGGLVDLLAAARAKAATMRVRPTLWQRVLAVLRRPPALAFATVVVLVGGAVLFIGRGRGMRAELAAGSSGAVKSYVQPVETTTAIAQPAAAEKEEMSANVEPPAGGPRAANVEPAAGAPAASADAVAPPAAVEVEVVPGRRAGIQRAPARPKRAQLEEMYRQCESAARRGDCATVRRMVGRIAKADRDYRARIVKEAAVAKCLADAAH
jgi:hypothetical protein